MIKIYPIIIYTLLIFNINACSVVDSNNGQSYLYKLTDISKLPNETSPKLDLCQSLNNHIIAINRRGEFKPIQFKHNELCNNKPELDAENHLNNIIESFRNSGKKRMMVFIHGGMNDYDSSISRLENDLPLILDERNDDYPIFIVWPSEALDSYGDSIYHYYQGTWDNNWFLLSVPFKFATDIAEIGIRSLLSYVKQSNLGIGTRCFSEFWEGNLPHCKKSIFSNDEINEVDRNPTYDPCKETKNETDSGFICIRTDRELAKDFDFNLNRFSNIAMTPLKLITVPVIDSLGDRDWYSQIGRVRFAFQKPCRDVYSGKGSCEDGIIKMFFDKLSKSLDKEREITIIGHSMGAILASEIIGKFPDLPYRNVVFIGAAVSIREFQNTVLTTLDKRIKNNEGIKNSEFICSNEKVNSSKVTANTPFCFYNLSLHPYAEATEENIYGAAPSGSLLEWIDGNFESPANLTDRTLGQWANIAPLSKYLAKNRSVNYLGRYVFFKRFGLGSLSPHTHGDLVDPKNNGFYWRPSYWY